MTGSGTHGADTANGPVALTRAECEHLLATAVVGRIAFNGADGIEILPVNYHVAGGSIWFRTLPYGVIATAVSSGAAVVFQADHHDDTFASGWSVLARGPVEVPEDGENVDAVRASARPRSWAGDTRALLLCLTPRTMTGRRVHASN